jgi:Bacterial TniB protein
MAGEDAFAHLPADMRSVALLDDEARIAHIRAERWIKHAAAERLLGYLQEGFDQPPRERMENLLLLGESGMGKTMLIRKFERQNAVGFDEAAGVQRRPVVVMLMPPQPTEVEFFNSVLEAIDAPSAGYWTGGGQLRTAAIRLLREVGVRVLVIDEINSVLVGSPGMHSCRMRSCTAVSATSSCHSGPRARICGTSSRVSYGASRCASHRRPIRRNCAPCWPSDQVASHWAFAKPWNARRSPPSAPDASGSSSPASRIRRSGAAWRRRAGDRGSGLGWHSRHDRDEAAQASSVGAKTVPG